MQITQSRIVIVLILLVSLALSSCADLGNYSDTEDYYSYFNYVSFYEDFSKTTTDMSEFYNEDSYNDTEIKSRIDEDNYQALVINVSKELNMSDFYIYFSSSENITLDFKFYITNKELETENVDIKDPTDDSKTISITRFKDLDVDPVLESTRSVHQKFNSIAFNTKLTKLNAGDNLIILFSDNCDLDKSNDVSFTFTNILIRNENL